MTNDLPAQQQQTDSDHLKLLYIFHYVLGGMAACFACLPILHLAFGLFLIVAPQKFGPASNQAPTFMGWLFVVLASVFILAGWTFAVLVGLAGRFIARRNHYNYCFVVACVECVFVPLGTILGVFTILVLMRPSVKGLFTPKPTL